MKAKLINTIPKLKKLAKRMMTIDEFAFDTETNTLEWANADNDIFRIVDISISWGEYDNYLIPIGHIVDPTPQLDSVTVAKYLKEPFEREDVTIIAHNCKYDMHVMKRIGIHIKTPHIFDTMIASWLCNENEEKGLKQNVERIFNHRMEHFNEVIAKIPKEVKKQYGLKANQKATIDLTMIGDSIEYATEDSYWTFRLYLHYLEELEKENMEKIYYKMYPPFVRVLFDMEEEGIRLDIEACNKMNEDIQADLDQLEYDILDLVGVQFDINSSQQLAQLLFGYDQFKTVNEELIKVSFKFPVQSTTAKGVPQTNNATLHTLSRMNYKDKKKQRGVEFVKKLMDYKELAKLKTFTSKFIEVVYPDGKIHCTFNPVGADSGRLSCSNPNMQQIPNNGDKYNIRSMFIADNENESIISCDQSNLEVRVMAHFSRDENLINAFHNGLDLHGNTAKLMFRLDCEANEVKKKYPDLRKAGKVTAFLLQYGGSVMALEELLNSDGMLTSMLQELKTYKSKKDLPDTLKPFWGCTKTKDMAQKLLDMYFEAFPGIANFMRKQKKFAHRNEYVMTVLGRKRRLPFINSNDHKMSSYAERLSLNAPIQGCQTYDTPILTTNGYKPISELNIDKDVLVTHTGVTSEYNVYKTGDKEVYKLTTLNTIQKVTLDHRFCVYDDGELIFKRLKELQPGDYIVNGNYNSVVCKTYDISIHEYIGALIGDGSYSSRNAMRLYGGKDKLNYLNLLKSFVEEIKK